MFEKGKRNMKKIITALLLIALLICSFSACSDDAEEPNDSESVLETESETETDTQPEEGDGENNGDEDEEGNENTPADGYESDGKWTPYL
jgi:hypothetical protein